MSHPFIPVANVASVELIYLFNGVTVENQIHVQKGSPFTFAQLQALRGVVDNWHNVSGKNIQGGGSSLVRIRSKALDTSSSPIEDYTLPTPRAGTVGGNSLPGNAAFAVKLSTGLAGRSFRGRMYLSALTTSDLLTNSNVLTAGAVAAFITSLTLLLTNLSAAGYTLGVVSYRSGGAYRTSGVFTAATGWVAVDNNVDSMRRRLTGRGI